MALLGAVVSSRQTHGLPQERPVPFHSNHHEAEEVWQLHVVDLRFRCDAGDPPYMYYKETRTILLVFFLGVVFYVLFV